MGISCALLSVSFSIGLHQSLTRVLWLLTSAWGVTLAKPPPPPPHPRPPLWWSLKSPRFQGPCPCPCPCPSPCNPAGRCILTHTACFFSFWASAAAAAAAFAVKCRCKRCSPALHLLPRTPPELQLCPHMPLSWRGLHLQWCKHLGPPHWPLNWGRARCNAGCNGCGTLAATACCTSLLSR